MPRVIYTPDIFSLQRVGGISRYFCELIHRVPDYGWSVTAGAGIHINKYLKQVRGTGALYLPKLGPLLGPHRLRFNRTLWRYIARKHPRAIIHQTYYSEQQFTYPNPLILTVPDLIDEKFPARRTAVPSSLKRQNCERADRIIAISDATKNDLIQTYKIPPDKIRVVYLADSLGDSNLPPAPVSARTNDLLFVGTRSDYKNFARLLEAFAASDFLKRNFRLLAFGGGDFSSAEKRQIKALKLGRVVRQIGGDDAALADWYRNSAALIYPSLYEGFGLPLLEAMGQNCAVICAQPGGSLEEIAGDAAAYFDPLNSADIQRVLEETLQDSERLENLRERGAANHEKFSWARCARETVALYDELVCESQ